MGRLEKNESGACFLDAADMTVDGRAASGRAVNRLAAYEDLREALRAGRAAVTRRLEERKREGRQRPSASANGWSKS